MKISSISTIIPLYLILLLIGCLNVSFAETSKDSKQNAEEIRKLSNRLEKVEGWEKVRNDQVKNYKDELNNRWTVSKALAALGISLGIGSIIGGYCRINNLVDKKTKELYEKAKEEVLEEIAAILKTDTERFRQMIKEHSEENQLRQTKRILVIYHPNTSHNELQFLENFFKTFEFKNVTFKKVPEYEEFRESFDVIFANNGQNEFDQTGRFQPIPTIDDFFQKSTPSTALFYYSTTGENQYKGQTKSIKNRLNFANSRATLYGNLINTLKYHDLLTAK